MNNLVKLCAKEGNLNHCAVPFLSRAATIPRRSDAIVPYCTMYTYRVRVDALCVCLLDALYVCLFAALHYKHQHSFVMTEAAKAYYTFLEQHVKILDRVIT